MRLRRFLNQSVDLKRFNKFIILNTTGRTFKTAIDAHLKY
jgi:hypothetical protein